MLYKQLILISFLFTSSFSYSFILKNEAVINKKASDKIELIGQEFYDKTNIAIYLVAVKKLDGKKISQFNKEYAKKLQEPFILLSLSKDDRKVDIILKSKEKLDLNTEYVLDDIIIPILVTKSRKNSSLSKHSAALLSGYSEIAEQISKSKDIELKNVIGNDSKNFIYWFRIFIYGSMIGVLIFYLYKRKKK